MLPLARALLGGVAPLVLFQTSLAAAEPPLRELSFEIGATESPNNDTIEIADDQVLEKDYIEQPVDRVVVVGRKYAPGGTPEAQLGGAEIDALAARDIGEVVGRAMTMSGSGALPVIIVNGERLPNADLVLGFPPDALERVEILSREATGRYGGNPSARIVNLVLKRRFRALEAGLSAAAPTAGGTFSAEGRLQRSAIDGQAFERIDGRFVAQTSLKADERPDYILNQPDAGSSTLRPQLRVATASLVANRPLGSWTGNVGLSASQQEHERSAVVGGGITSLRADVQSLGLVAGLGGRVGQWSTQAELQGRLTRDKQRGRSNADSESRSMGGRVSLSTNLDGLAPGPISVTLTGQANRSQSSIDYERTRRGWYQAAAGSLSIPLTIVANGGEERAFGIGSLSLSLGGGVKSSETGGGHDVNYGLAWSPTDLARFNADWSRSVDTPLADLLYAPASFGNVITIYDFQTGESANVLTITGGNPDLHPAEREIVSLSASVGPFSSWQILLGAEYQAGAETNGLGANLPFTPEIEAAFPERFVRGVDGKLAQIDLRPFNQEVAEASSLTSQLTFQTPHEMAGDAADVIDNLQVTLSHTWRLEDTVRLGRGLRAMDRLSGDNGGAPQHEVAIQLDAMRGPWTLNVGTRWMQHHRIRKDAGLNGPNDLLVDAFGTLDLKVGYALNGQMSASASDGGGARRGTGARIELSVENLFDTRPHASLTNGRRAPGYGRDDQDPLGRRLQLSLTRRF